MSPSLAALRLSISSKVSVWFCILALTSKRHSTYCFFREMSAASEHIILGSPSCEGKGQEVLNRKKISISSNASGTPDCAKRHIFILKNPFVARSSSLGYDEIERSEWVQPSWSEKPFNQIMRFLQPGNHLQKVELLSRETNFLGGWHPLTSLDQTELRVISSL